MTTAAAAERIDASLREKARGPGFERSQSMGRIRWTGLSGGRAARLTLSTQSRTRYAGEVRYRQRLGLRLRAELAASITEPVFFVPAPFTASRFVRFVYRLRRQAVLEHLPAALEGFHVVARDLDPARRLWALPESLDALAWMLRAKTDPAGQGLLGSVHGGGGTLYYASPILGAEAIDGDFVRGILDSLGWVAYAADRGTDHATSA